MRPKAETIAILALLSSIAVTAGPAAIGTISSCKGASIGGTKLEPGTTLFSGDKIDVGSGGKVWIAVSGGRQVEVLENSTVRLTKSADEIHLSIDHGNARTDGKGFVVSRESTDSRSPSVSSNGAEDNYTDKGCEVSRDSRRNRPCIDDTD
jgi:hypothetical protein